jgi:DNA-binding NarL/FixJ family response regulator
MHDRASVISPSPEPIRIVMVEARPLLGAGIREILDGQSDIEVVGQVGSPEEARQVVDETAPDVVLIEASLAESTGSIAARRLRRATPDAAFVVLGGHDDDASIIEAVEIGAMAHVSEVAQPAELVETIRRVAYGADPLKDQLQGRPDLLERALADLRDARPVIEVEANPLTPREIEVLRLVAQGYRNREIAGLLAVAEQTVKNQLRSATRKLRAPNRTQAVMSAMKRGWLRAEGPVESNVGSRWTPVLE